MDRVAKRYSKAPSDYFPALPPALKWQLDLACFLAGARQDSEDFEAEQRRADGVIDL